MPSPMIQAKPPLAFLPPKLDPFVVRTLYFLLPAWMKLNTNVQAVQAENVEQLVELYRQFQAGQVRFMLAFRHPSTNDPFSLGYLMSRIVPMVAKQQGVDLGFLVHAHFIYDRGIPLWAGQIVEWLYPRLGGTPIQRGKLDRVGLRSVRDLFANGRFPIAAAPEGATNGHNERVSPLEPGIAQMGFWCMEDLQKAGRSEQVLIVPIGLQYSYVEAPWTKIDRLLGQLEADLGIADNPELPEIPVSTVVTSLNQDNSQLTTLYPRLYRLGAHLLTLMEDFYRRFYHHTLTIANAQLEAANPESMSPNQALAHRLQALLDTALRVAEQYFDLQPKGSFIDRCRRLEQAAWDCIYREDLKQLDELSVVERNLADRIAEEANLRVWHMRLVESFVAVTGQYVREKPTAERFAETLLLTWETIERIKGNNTFPRPTLGKQIAHITIGKPISVSDRWQAYQGNRRNAKQEVERLTQDLQTALEAMIH